MEDRFVSDQHHQKVSPHGKDIAKNQLPYRTVYTEMGRSI